MHQVKEKYGTLRYYWGWPELRPACCKQRAATHPRPAGRDPQDPALAAWAEDETAHFESQEHAQEAEKLDSEISRRISLEDQIEAIVEAAEAASEKLCENCGAKGALCVSARWYKTLCEPCAKEKKLHTRNSPKLVSQKPEGGETDKRRSLLFGEAGSLV